MNHERKNFRLTDRAVKAATTRRPSAGRALAGRLACLLTCLVLGLVQGACSSGPRRCVVSTLGDLKVMNDVGQPIVRATINGTPVAFLIDTGAAFSIVSPEAAEALRLPYTGQFVPIQGVGGQTVGNVVTVDRLGLGSGTARDTLFAVAGHFPGHIGGLPVVGLFGGNFLAAAEPVFDLPAHQLDLYTVSGCDSPTPTWSGPTDMAPIEIEGDSAIMIDVLLNGHRVSAQLDSGAGHTVILPGDARHAGVDRARLSQDPHGHMHGVDDNRFEAHLHRFDSLQVGHAIYYKPWIAVAPMEIDHALLGADFLRHNRVWISYRTQRVYIQRLHAPDGDPTFQIRLRRLPPANPVPGTPVPGTLSPLPPVSTASR
ncbi:retroviral-like aspartic protease family protein [Nguyenibacter sp. L1]|uniref:retroviral-like aspartic protease family protein n=1 Tax=Nguyenibacter sp. L1 TaxID=3049350 RepID=UPI002B47839C|nr:retroviral-like aspartic protease family protein [Nguyenibacter sp. L1]WRH87403.1 retroviral-like aspartic protease family protein [Nguyenibacter sp. L1]